MEKSIFIADFHFFLFIPWGVGRSALRLIDDPDLITFILSLVSFLGLLFFVSFVGEEDGQTS
ncbi:MAG: hypothetical protein HZA36_03255 [Parcubacteria group bacterium]|nr:hypothetical protein [Parcubacteria group bacterium]